MKGKLLIASLSVAVSLQAQTSSKLFAVGDQQMGGYTWNTIRQLDLEKANVELLSNLKSSGQVINATAQLKTGEFSPTSANYQDQPLFSGVAALAYDQENNRLYFATMFTNELRYVNLGKNLPDRYYAAGNIGSAITSRPANFQITQQDQSGVVTRMAIGADNYGYGISNDGNSFFRFSLGKKTKIEEIGALIDDAANKNISVHTQCTSWGGDIVASATGELYLISMAKNVFRINPSTRIATHIGRITGLPENFSVNGAAVGENGEVILTTAAYGGSRGIMADITKLAAVEEKDATIYNASDLASSNLLFSKDRVVGDMPVKSDANSKISAYPNPIMDGYTVLSFEKISATGRYTVDLLGASGGLALRQSVTINANNQQVRVNTGTLAKGLYTVKVTNAETKQVYTTKLVIQ